MPARKTKLIIGSLGLILLLLVLSSLLKNLPQKQLFQKRVYETMPDIKDTCEAKEGKWEKTGPDQKEQCNLPPKDSGKECSNANECEGFCAAEPSAEDQEKLNRGEVIFTKGKCSAWKTNTGCLYRVMDGRLMGITCLD